MERFFRGKLINGVIAVCLMAIATSVGALYASRALVANLANFPVAGGAGVRQAEWVFTVVTIATILLLVVMCGLLVAALNASRRMQGVARARVETDRAAAEAALAEMVLAAKLKDEFLATVSHELRHPLAPILTWTQLLRSGTLDEAKSRRALEVIEQNVVSQTLLIDDLIDVARAVSGTFRVDSRPTDLAPVIRSAAESQGPASDARQVRVQLELDEHAGLVSGDSERLQQVMTNLISNAIKFTRKGGSVRVALRRVDSHVEVSVRDDGVGIGADFLPHVFEPFRQVTSGSTRSSSGLGLGLSIVRHLVELHGGQVSVHSDGANRGSEFTVALPLLAIAPDPAAAAPRRSVTRDTHGAINLKRLDGIRVLVVDDEPTANEALTALFVACGAEARSADSAAAAMDAFEGWLPDIMVSDIGMPGEDGYSLIRRIRARDPARGGDMPAVALTAYAKIEDRVRLLGAGFQVYLSKPADPRELVNVVDSLTRHRTRESTPRV